MPSVPLTSALTAPLSSSQTPPYESTEHYAEHTGGIQCVSVYYESSAVIQDPQNLAPTYLSNAGGDYVLTGAVCSKQSGVLPVTRTCHM